MRSLFFIFLAIHVTFISCSDSEPGMEMNEPDPMLVIPTLSILDRSLLEKDDQFDMIFEVKLSEATTEAITVDYALQGLTAEPGVDFGDQGGSFTIAAGDTKFELAVPILPDDIREVEEEFEVVLSNVKNATVTKDKAIGIILDDDDETANTVEDGYMTSETHYGYSLTWGDEFDGTSLNLEDYNFDLGDGCPNICGWGNNELEVYTDKPENIKVADGKLSITATKSGTSYESAKIHTKDKQSFVFGRIDIRAKLPEGQGIWPALWMLGQNIDEVGWPACGEIDIMEMVGHTPKVTHGTAHWGAAGGPSTFKGASFSLDEKFSDKFHVFSLVWEMNELVWYVDETKFFTANLATIGNEQWRFNQQFYLIFNVAVGGNWPGSPDATTVFPQTMDIDYVRVFQRT